MTDEEFETIKKLYGKSDRIGTHWAECWNAHVYCAVCKLIKEVERLKEERNG